MGAHSTGKLPRRSRRQGRVAMNREIKKGGFVYALLITVFESGVTIGGSGCRVRASDTRRGMTHIPHPLSPRGPLGAIVGL